MMSISAIDSVATRPIKAFDPINFILADSSAPDKNLIKPVLVIPKRNISTKEPAAINNTHWPNSSVAKLRASNAKLQIPNTAITRLPARERKLSSRMIVCNFFSKTLFISGF